MQHSFPVFAFCCLSPVLPLPFFDLPLPSLGLPLPSLDLPLPSLALLYCLSLAHFAVCPRWLRRLFLPIVDNRLLAIADLWVQREAVLNFSYTLSNRLIPRYLSNVKTKKPFPMSRSVLTIVLSILAN